MKSINAVSFEIAIHSENYTKHINYSVGRLQRESLEVKVEVVCMVTTLL
jgi:hypothetical protein